MFNSIVKRPRRAIKIPAYLRKRIFQNKQANPDRIKKRNNQDKSTIWCNSLQRGKECNIRWSCPYAHEQEELRQINFYNRTKHFKEIKCKDGKECKRKNCKFYHNEDEKRFNITMKRLSLQAQADSQDSWSIKKGWLKVSEALPSLSFFTDKETQQFADRIVELRDKENLKTKGAVSGVEVNLVQRSSNISNKEKWRLMTVLKDCQDFFFKSKEISYARIGRKKQFTFIVNSGQFVDDVCNEIKERKPSELKLVVKSVGNDWGKMCMLLEAIQASRGSLFKLELDIREILGPIDLPKLEKALRESLLPLNNLKCIKLRLEFGYIEYNGSYERDTIEIALDLLKDMLKKSSSRLDVSLSIFGLTVAKKGRSFEVKSDPISHQSERLRKELNKRLSCRMLYCHLIRYFSKLFLKTTNPERMIFDFSYIYGLAPKKSEQRSILAKKYEKEISALLHELSEILVRIKDQSLLQFSLKFFAFDFKFQSDLKQKVSLFSFQGNCLLPGQNKTISTFEDFDNLAVLVRSKLNLQYKYDILKGNLFVAGQLLQKCENQPQVDQIIDMKKGNAKFLECVMSNYSSLKKIYCSINETPQIVALFQEKQKTFPIFFEREISQVVSMFGKIMQINKVMSLFQSRLLLVLRAFVKARKLHPTFTFRHEVLFSILNVLELNDQGISDILSNLRKELEEKERQEILDHERRVRFWRGDSVEEMDEQLFIEDVSNNIEGKDDQVEEEEELDQVQQKLEGWN